MIMKVMVIMTMITYDDDNGHHDNFEIMIMKIMIIMMMITDIVVIIMMIRGCS